MGKNFTKTKMNANSSIGKEDYCPICSTYFLSSTTFNEVNFYLN